MKQYDAHIQDHLHFGMLAITMNPFFSHKLCHLTKLILKYVFLNYIKSQYLHIYIYISV